MKRRGKNFGTVTTKYSILIRKEPGNPIRLFYNSYSEWRRKVKELEKSGERFEITAKKKGYYYGGPFKQYNYYPYN